MRSRVFGSSIFFGRAVGFRVGAMAGLVLACLVARAEDWRGFHGLEKQGRAEAAAPPLSWSAGENVLWRTAIPGRGHSSPVVAGTNVFVTTAYETARLEAVRAACSHSASGLACLIAIVGFGLVARFLVGHATRGQAMLQYGRAFVFSLLIAISVGTVLFGENLLNIADSEQRAWKVTTALTLACVTLVSLHISARSVLWLLLGVLACAFTAPVWGLLPSDAVIFPLLSRTGLASKILLVLPPVLGLGLMAAHLAARRRWPTPVAPRQEPVTRGGLMARTAATAGLAIVVVTGLFVAWTFRWAYYSFEGVSWRSRVGWWTLGLLGVLCVVSIVMSARRRAHTPAPAVGRASPILTGAALLLAAVCFVQFNYFGRDRELVRAIVCLDAETGGIQWTAEGLQGSGDPISGANSPATPTPVVDDARVYAYFGSAGLMCVGRNGQRLWTNEQLPSATMFGAAASPMLHGERLIIVSDNRDSAGLAANHPSYMAAVDCRSGRIVWRRDRPRYESKDAIYATPLLCRLAGRDLIVAQGWNDIRAYDAGTGVERWSFPSAHEGAHLVASIVSDEERLYVSTLAKVTALDASKLERGGDPVIWSQEIGGEKSSTPVVADGLLFLVTEDGTAMCLDAATGAVQWKHRFKRRYYASVIAAGRFVYFVSEPGCISVVARDRAFKLEADNKLGEKIYATPVPAGNRLLIRTVEALYCIRGPSH